MKIIGGTEQNFIQETKLFSFILSIFGKQCFINEIHNDIFSSTKDYKMADKSIETDEVFIILLYLTVKSYSLDVCQKLEFFCSLQGTRKKKRFKKNQTTKENPSMKRKLYIIMYKGYDYRCLKAAFVWLSPQKTQVKKRISTGTELWALKNRIYKDKNDTFMVQFIDSMKQVDGLDWLYREKKI